ncbi:cysteine--tRNA ligase [Buchnera aphidicola (Thelaxes californica)]|uniref:Cysteine--tRNA ligase n=1 Tax=Buchnera aphidicola (Thelaxes californica) TaxID=1315998 RepID=A0A4D6YA58_9GAMM|nr:cysteine--tRNA ligase [Buchnera aphidicola]QCI26896.1 cysteine--tRNA ligase [Buchnera aphidicola (Thelaxes californica)]
MLKIFNSLNNQEEVFLSNNKKINLYVCGITAYDHCHIGHGRTFIFFDVVVRYLKFIGYKVNYIRNITDIDDKIINKSLKEKINYKKIVEKTIHSMNQDFKLLNMLKPDKEPLVTHHINEIICMINSLLKKNFAYISKNGDVNFSINRCEHYGNLSNQILSKIKSFKKNNRVLYKNNELDFVLWKKSKLNEPFWLSPWGKGRPGWHIECSAISSIYLKKNCDIHGGGIDLLFPHHENEKAQSDCFYGKKYVNYWMHVGSVLINNQKMSKSLNNTIRLNTLLQKYDPEIIRFYILSQHYRKPLNYVESKLNQATSAMYRLYTVLSDINFYETLNVCNKDLQNNDYTLFKKIMDSDFNTPHVLSMMFKIVKQINILKSTNKFKVYQLALKLKTIGNILGILFYNPHIFLKKKYLYLPISIQKIELLITIRQHARLYKKWKKADVIRKKLKFLGINLKDNNNCTSWYYL